MPDAGDHDPATPVVRSARHHYIPSPPSTSSTAPVMNDASSEQRNRTAPATSSASPRRPRGVFWSIASVASLGEDVRELRLHVAGNDDVRANVPAAELAREGLREPDDPRLRRRVVRLAPVPVDADDGRDVHDRASALLHHPAGGRAARVEARREIRVDDRVPVLVRHAHEEAVARHPGVVHEDVEVARLLDERASRLRVGDVGLHRPASDLGRERLGLVRSSAIREDDRRASRRELGRDRAPDAPGCARDEGGSALERAERLRHRASASCARSRLSSEFTDIVLTPRSIRLTRPESTFPGPTSTNVVAPLRMSSVAACVNRTGPVS